MVPIYLIMQQYGDQQILYSPSDLVAFLGCRHATFLSVKALDGGMQKSAPGELEKLLQKKGLAHEAAYLERLKKEGKTVVEIPAGGDYPSRAAATLAAMRDGADVIYQAVFFAAPQEVIGICAVADFLIKRGVPSALGEFSYEVLDTKLARTAHPKHIMQLCAYSDRLEKLQGLRPVNMYLLLGDNRKQAFRAADFFYYYTCARQRFEGYLRNLPAASSADPCNHCGYCQWRDDCNAHWLETDHLSRVANIRRTQMVKLRQAGIGTVADLARAATVPSRDINEAVYRRLHSQAALQHHKAVTGKNKYDLIPSCDGGGFARMPRPAEGDVFFDLEGDPLYPDGLEYLFGVHYIRDGKEIFKPFWAHNHRQEKKAFKRLMKFLAAHLAAHPHAYIYHYAPYETTALKRLACYYAACEEQLDNLLREQKFIDLYRVVRESIRTSEPGYSLKNLETFYMEERADEVATAADSIIIYNQWRESGEKKLLQDIADYNETDCISTRRLRDWLLRLRPEECPWFNGVREAAEEEKSPRKDWETRYEIYQARLGMNDDNPPVLNKRLFHLLEFHNREAKTQWWSLFERQGKQVDELIDDAECLGGLRRVEDPVFDGLSLSYCYHFPPQEYKLKAGQRPVDVATLYKVGTILEIDEESRTVSIQGRAFRGELPETLSIGPSGPIDSDVIRAAIYRTADYVLDKPARPRAAVELLSRRIPRIRGKRRGEEIITSDELHSEAMEVIAALNNSYLFIQGPPGSGKTYTGSHLIVDLLRRGKKIGVTSNSHKAIHNLLAMVERVATEKGVEFTGIKKATQGNEESVFKGDFICSVTGVRDMDLAADLFAGTAWTFANLYFEGVLDYLFIDEAGQVSTANVVAMATAAKNIILLGDQMQLGQPIQGVHPGESGLSVLEFLLEEQATVARDRGIFLGKTRRMRPSVCRFISEAFYDGRLTAHESVEARRLSLRDISLPDEGVVMIPAHHEGCSQKSEEEGKIIKGYYEALLHQSFSEEGTVRGITEEDILIVTPYNVQVNYLRSLLPDARIGTVDKFQGQEAPIVLISMVTSSAEDLPRHVEFLYSRNRLNVAVSRAQCLAVIVVNPRLMEISCKTVEQMRLVNTLCRLNEYVWGGGVAGMDIFCGKKNTFEK